jgi:hypothetical protein
MDLPANLGDPAGVQTAQAYAQFAIISRGQPVNDSVGKRVGHLRASFIHAGRSCDETIDGAVKFLGRTRPAARYIRNLTANFGHRFGNPIVAYGAINQPEALKAR